MTGILLTLVIAAAAGIAVLNGGLLQQGDRIPVKVRSNPNDEEATENGASDES